MEAGRPVTRSSHRIGADLLSQLGQTIRLPEPQGQQIDFRGGFLHPLDEKHRLYLSGVRALSRGWEGGMAGSNPVTSLPQAPESTFGICAPADEALLESCVLQLHYRFRRLGSAAPVVSLSVARRRAP